MGYQLLLLRREQEVASHTLFQLLGLDCIYRKSIRALQATYSCPYCKVKRKDLEQWTKIIFQNINHRENLEVGNREHKVFTLAVGE